MLLTERKTLPASDEWLWEIKFDGYRMLATTGTPQLKTKGGADATKWFPEVVAALATLPAGNIVDGEVCVLDDIGRSDFNRTHARAIHRGWYAGADPVAYCIFDLIVGSGQDLRGQSLERRRAALATLLANKPDGLLFVQNVEDGAWLYQQALALGLEGIVGKRAGSTSQAGVRSPDWIKVKRPGAVTAQRFRR